MPLYSLLSHKDLLLLLPTPLCLTFFFSLSPLAHSIVSFIPPPHSSTNNSSHCGLTFTWLERVRAHTMAPSRRSSSRLWEIAFQKLFPKRAFQSRQSQNNVLPESSDCEHTDGFYMYSQNQLEEEAQQLEALQLQTSNSTEGSYSSAVSDPSLLFSPDSLPSALETFFEISRQELTKEY
ncbi:hypothetical protein AWENTII_001854 [Aspergillus wentii]